MKLVFVWKNILEYFSIQWQKKLIKNISYTLISFIIVILLIYFAAWRAPADFPLGSLYSVEQGTGLTKTAMELREKNIIHSEFWFKSALVLFGGPKGLIAGDYVLPNKQNVFKLAFRLSHGDYKLVPVRITVPEGYTTFEIADLLVQKLPKIDREDFIKKSAEFEGYLFPDTYYFLPNSNTQTVIGAMRKNFELKITELDETIRAFDKPIGDIIKMASIVEKEARKMETRQIIAGILWKRIALDMPLQVDVSFKYINGKVTKDLSLDDLKVDSPYNSYIYKGLPPTPISNPSLDSILATVTPIETDYLFFLTGRDGIMHYAKTYATHLKNKELYLD